MIDKEKTPSRNDNSLPGSVLFICNYNSVRSPMAEAICKGLCGHNIFVDSAGIKGDNIETNPFSIAVIEEIGLDLSNHKPKKFDDLNDHSFDLVVALSADAHKKAIEIARLLAVDVEYWPTNDPSTITGNRENILNSFRAVRDTLREKIKDCLINKNPDNQ